jgi:hypothetical protein
VRKVDATLALAVGLPLLVLLAALLVRPGDVAHEGGAPEETPLTSATVICPSGPAGVVVADDTGATGAVTVRQGDNETDAAQSSYRSTELPAGRAPVVVTAEGDLAPGVLAGRSGSPLVAPECRPPAFDEWFTGVGAGAKHASVLELVNPDAGPAIVDTLVYGKAGPVDAPVLRGVAVPGNSVRRIDLAKALPRRDELALHVVTTRGRVSAAMLDRYDELGNRGASSDYLPSQAEPATSNLLLGIPDGAGRRVLLLANRAETETRASIKVVTEKAVFAAVDTEDVLLPPQSVTKVSIAPLLRGENAADAIGLLVESGTPVTATARYFIDRDLSHAVPPEPLAETSTLLPEGRKRLLLGGASGAGVVRVVARDAAGEVLDDRRVEVGADRGAAVGLPGKAVLLTVTTNGTTVAGSVLATGKGAAVIRLRPQQRSGLVAHVRPGVPYVSSPPG